MEFQYIKPIKLLFLLVSISRKHKRLAGSLKNLVCKKGTVFKNNLYIKNMVLLFCLFLNNSAILVVRRTRLFISTLFDKICILVENYMEDNDLSLHVMLFVHVILMIKWLNMSQKCWDNHIKWSVLLIFFSYYIAYNFSLMLKDGILILIRPFFKKFLILDSAQRLELHLSLQRISKIIC